MAKNAIRFKGHESFILRDGWLNKGLQEVKKDSRVFYENFGADALGVGSNMAKAIRYWMRCAKLIQEETREVKLTGLGELILEKDPYFEDVCSLWVVHCNIARNRKDATAWELFFNHFDYEEFTREELAKEMTAMAEQSAEGRHISQKSVLEDCEAILRMYTRKKEKDENPEEKRVSPFGKMGLVQKYQGEYRKEQPDLNQLPAAVVHYLLAECMEKEQGINMDELLNMPGGPGKILNLKRTGLVELLEQLEASGEIVMNRTAGLDMVYLAKEEDAGQVLRNYYK